MLRARAGPLEQDAAWGVARQLFAPLQRGPAWSELTVGAAGLSRRALDPEAPEPALAGDAMHAAAHGLEWLAANLAERGADRARRRRRPLGRRAVAALAGAARRPAGRVCGSGCLCAVRSGEPAGQPGPAGGAAGRRAGGPVAPARARPGRRGGAGARAASRGGSELRACLPRRHRRATRSCSAPCSVTLRVRARHADRASRRRAERVRARAGRPQRAAPARPAARGRGGARARARRARPQRTAAARRAARPARRPRTRRGWPTRCGRRGCVEGERELALAHPLVAGALRASLGAGELGSVARRAAAMLAAEGADPERVALHLLRTDPAAAAETVAVLRAAAERAIARGAPESAATFLRRALAEPPLEPAIAADVRLELGLALAAHVQPEARRPAARGGGAGGIARPAGRDRAPRRPRAGSGRPLPRRARPLSPRAGARRRRRSRSRRAARGRARLQRIAARRRRARRCARDSRARPSRPTTLELWRAQRGHAGHVRRAAGRRRARAAPARARGRRAGGEPDSLLDTTVATFVLIHERRARRRLRRAAPRSSTSPARAAG